MAAASALLVLRKPMKLDAVRREGNSLVLDTADPAAWRFLMAFKPGEYEITRKKKKRSLDANAYAWALIDKIAEATRMDKTDVYRREIREIGGASEIVCIQEDAAEMMTRIWEKNGLGWQVERLTSKIPGCVNLVLHYGSSAYDTHQMSVFLDQIIQDAKALDIETLTDRELSLLKEEWR